MQRHSRLAALLLAFLLCASNADALTSTYGQREIAEAGDGCVGGLVSSHYNTAYFCGDTELLNRQLASLAAASPASRPVKVVLHTGRHLVDPMEEQPQTGFGDQRPLRLAVDWSIQRFSALDAVLDDRFHHGSRITKVDIWVTGDIQLCDLSIPAGFSVESGREIDRFVENHSNAK